MKIVLQKYIAESGLCSRRAAGELVRQGKVTVNKKRAELGMKVDEDDDIRVDGEKIPLANKKIYIILNKPRGYVCTNRRFADEKNIFDLVDVKEKLFVAGRLDKDSRGLVLLTNDGELTQRITHPKFEHEKQYIATIKSCKIKIPYDKLMASFRRGIDIGEDDGIARAKNMKYLGGDKFEIILTEGKKRQIRRMFKVSGFEVIDLVRVRIGGIELGNLPNGKWKKINPISN